MCIICKGESISHLNYIDCSGCKHLTIIPSFPNLQYVDCRDCPLLRSIETMPKLSTIICGSCPSLVSIGYMPELSHMCLFNCKALAYAPRYSKSYYYINMTDLYGMNPHSKFLISRNTNKLYNNIASLWKRYKLICLAQQLYRLEYSNLDNIMNWYNSLYGYRPETSKRVRYITNDGRLLLLKLQVRY